MYKVILFACFLSPSIVTTAISAQNPWDLLAMVDSESKFDDLLGMVTKKVTPTPMARSLNEKEITLAGFMIALDVTSEQSHFMFSRYPQNMCFFCGAAGPESAMQVFMNKGVKIPYDKDKVKLKGILQIQQNDQSGLIYFLQNAILVE